MDQQNWNLLEEIFHHALELPSAERDSYIAQQCACPTLRSEVASLLAAAEQGEWLDVPASTAMRPLVDLTAQLVLQEQSGTAARGNTLHDSRAWQAAKGSTEPGERPPAECTADIQYWQAQVGERYVLHSVLGQGGLGTVFSAEDRTLQRRVAIKVINGRNLDEASRRRLRRESRAAAQTTSDYLVTVHAIEDGRDFPYLVMEYIAGETLAERIVRQQTLEPQLAAQLVRQIALGLAEAHTSGLIHRDIKPSNVLLEPNREDRFGVRAKLTDFGLARTMDAADGDSLASVCVGTPAYMSPEQIVDPAQVDNRSDVYSLGATLYQCLTGVVPFAGTTLSIMRSIQFDEPLAVRRLNGTVPVDLESICNRAMRKEPRGRYLSAEDMADDLRRFLDGLPTRARPTTRLQSMHKWVLRNRKEARLLAGIVLMIGLLTVGSLVTTALVVSKNREILESRRQSLAARVDQVLHCSPVSLPLALQLLDDGDAFPRQAFERVIADPQRSLQERINAAVACSLAGSPQTEFLVASISSCRATPAQASMFYRALAADVDGAVQAINGRREQPVTLNEQFRLAYLLAALGDMQAINDGCIAAEPTFRSELIAALAGFCGDRPLLVKLLADPGLVDDAKSAILCGLTTCDFAAWDIRDRVALAEQAVAWRASSHAGLAAAATTLWQRWSGDAAFIEAIRDGVGPGAATQPSRARATGGELLNAAFPTATEFEAEVRMVRVPLGTVLMGRAEDEIYEGYPLHRVTLSRPYEIMDREVSVGLFQEFQWSLAAGAAEHHRALEMVQPDATISPADDYPMQSCSWFHAVQFCNWLSRRHGLVECYAIGEQVERGAEPVIEHGVEQVAGERLLQVAIDWEAGGFRLPTEAEWEYACRAGAETDFCFGNDVERLEAYARVSNARRVSAFPCGQLLPNRWGLYDMHGNVWEWCQDWMHDLDGQPLIDPLGPVDPLPERFAKIYRGSGVVTLSGEPTAGARGRTEPTATYLNLGFRVARTVR